MSPLFTAQAQSRAVALGVAAQVTFIHGDAAGHVADHKVDVAACIGASWIGRGVAGTIALLAQSLRHVTYTREYLGWGVFALMAR